MLVENKNLNRRLSEGRGRSLSSVNWFCKEAKYFHILHSQDGFFSEFAFYFTFYFSFYFGHGFLKESGLNLFN